MKKYGIIMMSLILNCSAFILFASPPRFLRGKIEEMTSEEIKKRKEEDEFCKYERARIQAFYDVLLHRVEYNIHVQGSSDDEKTTACNNLQESFETEYLKKYNASAHIANLLACQDPRELSNKALADVIIDSYKNRTGRRVMLPSKHILLLEIIKEGDLNKFWKFIAAHNNQSSSGHSTDYKSLSIEALCHVAGRPGMLRMFKDLCQKHKSVLNDIWGKGHSILHDAVFNFAQVEYLFREGLCSDANVKDSQGRTPLDHLLYLYDGDKSIKNGIKSCLLSGQFLIKHGAIVTSDNEKSLLGYAKFLDEDILNLQNACVESSCQWRMEKLKKLECPSGTTWVKFIEAALEKQKPLSA